MRHDVKYQSHLSAVRQRPDGSLVMQQQQQQQQHNMGYHRKHYHHDNENHYNNNNFNRYNNNNKYYGSSTYDERMGYPRDISLNSDNGGTVSALSGSSHESEKQWEWLEDVLVKSSKNRETVSTYIKKKTL
jgi:hypothetical protein